MIREDLEGAMEPDRTSIPGFRPFGGFACRGVTLVEFATVIAVVTVLLGILVPVLGSAKKQARVANDISELHDLALAAALYSDQYSGFPAGCPNLVQVDLVPEATCGALADPFPSGAANYLDTQLSSLSSLYLGLPTNYRNSFVGAREIGSSARSLKDELAGMANPGWLIDLSPATPPNPPSMVWQGRYRRLLYDSSVMTRTTSMEDTVYNGRLAKHGQFINFFGDPQGGEP
jgi:hypothetical protein